MFDCNGIVRFENVKNFNLDDNYPTIDKVMMPRIESVELFYFEGKNLADFFKNHPTLTKLNLKLRYGARDNYPQWEELVAELHNLVEIKFDKNYESVEDITKIIENHGKLKRFEFWTGKYDKTDFEQLYK